MGVADVLLVLGIIGVIVWLVLAKIMKNNPQAADALKPFLSGLEEKKESIEDKMKVEQIYNEKRSML